MPTQDDLFDDVVHRRIALERYSTTQVRVILRYLLKVEKDLVQKIAGLAVDGLNTVPQETMLASVRSLYRDSYIRLRELLNDDFKGLAEAEAEFRLSILKKAQKVDGVTGAVASTQLSGLSATQALVAATSKPMAGKLMASWVEDMSDNHLAAVEQAIRISYTEGESLSKMIKRVRDVSQLNKRGAEAIVRTANTHISSAISQATYKANRKVLRGWQFMAVLDSRTTLICSGLDGSIHPIGKGPFPPRHIRCRSTDMPVLIGMDGIPRMSYQQWLKRQPDEVIRDILGPTRARLFKSGKLTLDRFTDSNGKVLTLKQLKVKTNV